MMRLAIPLIKCKNPKYHSTFPSGVDVSGGSGGSGGTQEGGPLLTSAFDSKTNRSP